MRHIVRWIDAKSEMYHVPHKSYHWIAKEKALYHLIGHTKAKSNATFHLLVRLSLVKMTPFFKVQ